MTHGAGDYRTLPLHSLLLAYVRYSREPIPGHPISLSSGSFVPGTTQKAGDTGRNALNPNPPLLTKPSESETSRYASKNSQNYELRRDCERLFSTQALGGPHSPVRKPGRSKARISQGAREHAAHCPDAITCRMGVEKT